MLDLPSLDLPLFARGCSGVILGCLNPISSAKSLKSVELKGGPLSLSILSGIPCIANIDLSLPHVTLHDVDVVCSTTGNLVLLSITTRL